MKVKSQRRVEAIERNASWEKLSLTDQIKSLDNKLGVDIGAKRQRARIQAQIQKQTKVTDET